MAEIRTGLTSLLGKRSSLPRAAMFSLLAIILSIVSDVSARGNGVTVRIDVSSAHLAKPVSISNRDLLELSNVYGGQFLGELAEAPATSWPRYKVVLVFESRTPMPQLQLTGKQKLYTIEYALDRETGEGFVYLPGINEPGYRGNAGIMMRDGQDGRWHKATATWASLLNSYLE